MFTTSTGPLTEAGKARSSKNATKTGLFTAQDFVREGEAEEYAATRAALHAQISPEGCLEETFTSEIVSAAWRLRRCRALEAELAGRSEIQLLISNNAEHEQRSIDRARAQSHHILCRSLAELRKLQTERGIRREIAAEGIPTLTDVKQVSAAVNLQRRQARQAPREIVESTVEHTQEAKAATETDDSSFCKPAPQAPERTRQTPRNVPCPCNSGTKYKRCCGKNAPPVLSVAA